MNRPGVAKKHCKQYLVKITTFSPGQAYTYCYVCLGEFWGFQSGWLSTIPYTIATAAVARGWANYMGSFLGAAFGVRMPDWMGRAVDSKEFNLIC